MLELVAKTCEGAARGTGKLTVSVTPSILNKSVLLFTQYFLKLFLGGLTEIENSFNLKITVNVAKTSHNMGLF